MGNTITTIETIHAYPFVSDVTAARERTSKRLSRHHHSVHTNLPPLLTPLTTYLGRFLLFYHHTHPRRSPTRDQLEHILRITSTIKVLQTSLSELQRDVDNISSQWRGFNRDEGALDEEVERMREGGKDMARPREVMLENFETCVRHLGMRITVWERKVRVLEGAVERNRWMWREDGVRFRARWGVEESDDEDEFGGRVDEGVSFVREMRRVRRERKKQKEMEQMQNQGSGAPLTQVNSADEGVGHMA